MIDINEIESMKQWTNDYKVRMFWDLVAEVKRLREENELYNMCIFASYFRDKPGSALHKLTQMRFNQRREEE